MRKRCVQKVSPLQFRASSGINCADSGKVCIQPGPSNFSRCVLKFLAGGIGLLGSAKVCDRQSGAQSGREARQRQRQPPLLQEQMQRQQADAFAQVALQPDVGALPDNYEYGFCAVSHAHRCCANFLPAATCSKEQAGVGVTAPQRAWRTASIAIFHSGLSPCACEQPLHTSEQCGYLRLYKKDPVHLHWF